MSDSLSNCTAAPNSSSSTVQMGRFKFCTARLSGRILDVLFLILVIGGLGLSYSGLIRPRGAGFYCDDLSIKHTYQGDTISVAQLFLGSLLAPIFFILPVELFDKWSKYRHADKRAFFLNAWKSSWKVWKAVLLGVLTVLVVTEFSKGVVSEPRPHFWDTCKPNVTKEICDAGYVIDYTCTSTGFTARQILDAQKSFPSGHTSVSVFAAVFMVWYLGRVIQWPHSFFLTPCLQLIWVCFAVYCALTRITDRRHHWWDVLAGGTLGLGVAFVVTKAMTRSIIAGKDSMVSDRDSPLDNNFKEDVTSVYALKTNPSKRPSVRRLLSTSSVATTITEDSELSDIAAS